MRTKKNIIIKTCLGTYSARFISNTPEKGYTVTVPELKGIVTCGDNLIEAKKMAKEAIELHCECLLDDGLAKVKVERKFEKPRVHKFLVQKHLATSKAR